MPTLSNIHLQRLSRRLGYEFSDGALLELALTHRSFGSTNNERLEFLGDSILNFVVGEWLFRRFEEAREGQLSRLRSQMVKGETLAEIARELELGDHLRLGEGELKSGGFRRDSILADVVEAIIGAVYLDSGMEAAAESVLRWYMPRLQKLSLDKPSKDSKTALQEYLQARKMPLPVYEVVTIDGEAHAQLFTVQCRVGTLLQQPTTATSSSRKNAEKLAAKEALDLITGSADD